MSGAEPLVRDFMRATVRLTCSRRLKVVMNVVSDVVEEFLKLIAAIIHVHYVFLFVRGRSRHLIASH